MTGTDEDLGQLVTAMAEGDSTAEAPLRDLLAERASEDPRSFSGRVRMALEALDSLAFGRWTLSVLPDIVSFLTTYHADPTTMILFIDTFLPAQRPTRRPDRRWFVLEDILVKWGVYFRVALIMRRDA